MNKEINLASVSVTDMLSYVKYCRKRADEHKLLADNGKQDEYDSYHALQLKAYEVEMFVEAYIRESVKGTAGINLSSLNDQFKFKALNIASIPKSIKKQKSHDKGEVTDAEIIEDEKKEAKKINEEWKLVLEGAYDEEIAILSKRNKNEPEWVRAARQTICASISCGKRDELARYLSEFMFKDKGINLARAHKFINACKETYKLVEPDKKYKKNRKIDDMPTGKKLMCKYIVHDPDKNYEKEGLMRRHSHRINEMVDLKNQAIKICGIEDVTAWRVPFPNET